MKAVVGSAAGAGNPVMRPTSVCSARKGTQENKRLTTTPAMVAKYGMAKNSCKDTNQWIRPVAGGGRNPRLFDGCGRTRDDIH